MSTNYRKFANSTTRDFDNEIKLEQGNLSWDTNNGLCLHDGVQPGGHPIMAVREYQDVYGTISLVNLNNGTFGIPGDVSNQWFTQTGRVIYFTRDMNENPYTIVDRSYDNITDKTIITVQGSGYDYANGDSFALTKQFGIVNQLVEGGGIALQRNDGKLQVSTRFPGQERIWLNESTLNSGIIKQNITNTLISFEVDPNYTTGTPGETHNLTLPFDGMGMDSNWHPDSSLAVGTRVSFVNVSPFTINVSGWPAPGWDIAPYASADFIYYYDADYGGNIWRVISSFVWP